MAPSDQYMLNQLSVATPEDIQVILLTGVLRFLHLLTQALGSKDFDTVAAQSIKITNILLHLESMLVPGTPVSGNLERLYGSWLGILKSNGSRKHLLLSQMAGEVTEIRAAWAQKAREPGK